MVARLSVSTFCLANSGQVPSLNDNSVDVLRPGTMVQFRCMVQDTFDPEYYFDVYEEKNSEGEGVLVDVSVMSSSGAVAQVRQVH